MSEYLRIWSASIQKDSHVRIGHLAHGEQVWPVSFSVLLKIFTKEEALDKA
jgi:hypothetical protein